MSDGRWLILVVGKNLFALPLEVYDTIGSESGPGELEVAQCVATADLLGALAVEAVVDMLLGVM